MGNILCKRVFIIGLGFLLSSLGAGAVDTSILEAEFRDSITNSKTVFSPFIADQTYSIGVRVYEGSGNPAHNVLGLYRFRKDQLQFIGPADDCAELNPFDPNSTEGKIVCAYNTVSLRKTRTLSFRLVNPNDCGNGKKISLGYGFTASATNSIDGILGALPPTVEVICPEKPVNDKDVDMRLRYSLQPPSSIDSYNIFSLKLVAENIDTDKLEIYNSKITLNYPTALEHVPGLSPSDNCIELEPGELSCDYFTLKPGKTKELNFRLASTNTPCQNQIGTYSFLVSGFSDAVHENQKTNEVNPSNNTNVKSANFNISCQNIPDISIRLKDHSHIDLVNPDGDSNHGGNGKWGGELFYQVEVYNPYPYDLKIGALDYKFKESNEIQSMMDRVDADNLSLGCSADRYKVSCDFGTVAAGTKIIKNFSLKIKNPNPYQDRSPFDPLALCAQNTMDLRNYDIDEIVSFNNLKGLNKGSSGYYMNLDSSALKGLDCNTQNYLP